MLQFYTPSTRTSIYVGNFDALELIERARYNIMQLERSITSVTAVLEVVVSASELMLYPTSDLVS